jgi:hypothetical protein
MTIFYGAHGAFGAGSESVESAVMDVRVGAQAGLGRVVDARTLAQAAQMFEVLGRTPTASQLHEAAEVIGQRIAYVNEYKYEADIYFYKDLGEALGGTSTEEVYQIQLVLDSPLYNIGTRYIGKQVGASIAIGYGDLYQDVSSDFLGATSYANLFASFATIVNSANVMGYGNVGCALSEEATQVFTESVGSGSCENFLTMHAGAHASVDHSATWNTGVGVDLSPTLATSGDGGLYSMDMDLLFQSNLAVGSRLLWGAYATAGYTTTQGQGDATVWSLSTDLTYFIF